MKKLDMREGARDGGTKRGNGGRREGGNPSEAG